MQWVERGCISAHLKVKPRGPYFLFPFKFGLIKTHFTFHLVNMIQDLLSILFIHLGQNVTVGAVAPGALLSHHMLEIEAVYLLEIQPSEQISHSDSSLGGVSTKEPFPEFSVEGRDATLELVLNFLGAPATLALAVAA
jgi:hypothetical protein